MGQAKRRGTDKERQEAANAIANELADVLDAGHTPNYTLIFDRSEKGLKTLNYIRRHGPEELRMRFRGGIAELWLNSEFEFLALWGSWGWTGGLGLPTRDMPVLLNQTLGTIEDRRRRHGGASAVFLAVADDKQSAIMTRIKELEADEPPETGPLTKISSQSEADGHLSWDVYRSTEAGTLFSLDISHAYVESGQTEELVKLLHQFFGTAYVTTREESARRCQQSSLVIGLQGFEDDPREIWQIPIARDFFLRLMNAFPAWIYLVHPSMYLLFFGVIGELPIVGRGDDDTISAFMSAESIDQINDRIGSSIEAAAALHVKAERGNQEIMSSILTLCSTVRATLEQFSAPIAETVKTMEDTIRKTGKFVFKGTTTLN